MPNIQMKAGDSMIGYKNLNDGVETTGDECNRVGCEIGTHPKDKAEIEEIVHPV